MGTVEEELKRIADSLEALRGIFEDLSPDWTLPTSERGNTQKDPIKWGSSAGERNPVRDLATSYLKEKTDSGSWGPGMPEINSKWVLDFCDFVGGGTPIDQITRDQVLAWRKTLQDLPTNTGSKRSPATINKCLGYASAFFAWARDIRGVIERDPTVKTKLTVPHRRKRVGFSQPEVSQVWEDLRIDAPTLAHFWLPTILLFTGARPEEVAQLDPEREIIWPDGDQPGYFDFRAVEEDDEDGERSIKTLAGFRKVPMHSQLIELGFKDEVAWCLAGLEPNKKGRRSAAVGQWFNKRLRRHDYPKSRVLYSLRHTFRTEMSVVGVEEHIIAQILGHSNSSITTGRYGRGLTTTELSPYIEKIGFGV